MEYFIIFALIMLLVAALVYFQTKSDYRESKVAFTTRQLMYVVSMAALSIVIGIFEIPIGITGVKFDFSEIIILISYLLLGFKGSSLVIIFRSLIRFVLPAKTGAEAEIIIKFIGEIIAILASFLLISAYVITKKIFKKKEHPLLIAVPTESKLPSMKFYIVYTLLSIVLLLVGTTIFHVLFTMPIYTSVFAPSSSGKIHIFITSFLADPNYNDNLNSILIFIMANFAVLNIVKAAFSAIIFLTVKPRIEKVVK